MGLVSFFSHFLYLQKLTILRQNAIPPWQMTEKLKHNCGFLSLSHYRVQNTPKAYKQDLTVRGYLQVGLRLRERSCASIKTQKTLQFGIIRFVPVKPRFPHQALSTAPLSGRKWSISMRFSALSRN